MAKPSQSTKFRKFDIDELDENNFQDEQVEEVGPSGPDEGEVNNFLLQKKTLDALKAVLQNPPLLSKNQALKDKSFNLVMRVLTSFSSKDIEQGVKSLGTTEIDILMKYIYRGFAEPTENRSAVLLSWHEKVLSTYGLGAIIRVLTDRKTV